MAMSRKQTLIFALLALVFAGGCGGESASWWNQIHELSSEPACYVPPPAVDIPEGTSAEVVRLTQRLNAYRDGWSNLCLGRYQKLFDAIKSNPDATAWTFASKGDGKHLQAKLLQAKLVDFSSGRFALDLIRPETEQSDACMDTSFALAAVGTFSPEGSSLTQTQFRIDWNDFAVMVTLPSGDIEGSGFPATVYLHRGCDPSTQVSFGELIDYTPGQRVSCWKDGAFRSCDGVNTWPIRAAD
jgi:hypothetical protein